MPDSISIALTQLALWSDPTRIQTWPSFLASLPEGVTAKSPTDLGRHFATERMTSDRHSAAYSLVRNLPGVETRGRQLQLRGVGFLKRTSAGYQVSDRGRAVGSAYAAEPGGDGWIGLLVDALLGREPRTRAFVKLLSDRGTALVFEGDTLFQGSYRRARLVRNGLPDLYPLDGSGMLPNLRQPLMEDAWWCLGDWRTDPMLKDASSCRFRGIRDEHFSLHDIGLALRAACEVMIVAKLLRASAGSVHLDPAAATALLPDRASDFGWAPDASTAGELITALTDILPTLRLPTGHVVASELRDLLRIRGVADPDRAMAMAESEGRLLVYAEDYGQSRHGSGLFGDPRKQLVKLRIIGGGVHI